MKERRSIKKYKADVMVPNELIDKVIEAGLYAASGRGKQSPVIIAVTNKELRDIIIEKNCQIGGFQEEFEDDFGKEILRQLGIEGDYVGVGHLALGYADMDLPEVPPRKENRVYYIR